MSFLESTIDAREDQYGRYISSVLAALQGAVETRVGEGRSRAEIARRIGMDRSYLTRVLNGNVGNLTARTISDILWAADFDPEDLIATAYETLSPNHHCLTKDEAKSMASSHTPSKFVIASVKTSVSVLEAKPNRKLVDA